MLILRFFPDPALKRVAEKVTKFDRRLSKITMDMVNVMFSSNGIGLAAPQVGISKRIVICHDPRVKRTYVLINPEILHTEGEQKGLEGCLSFPDMFKEVQRPEKVTAKYQDINGKPQIIKADGIMARCILHEIEHLDGILLIDSQDKKVSK